MKKSILIIAGEPSGDMRGAEIVSEIKKLIADVHIWGIGGDNMQREGVELTDHVKNLSFMGIMGVLKNLGKIRKQFKDITTEAKKRNPDLAVLIDYPGFNLRVAKALHKMNIPVVYYIIPQVWVWHESRIKPLKAFTKKILVLFKFEQTFLKERDTDSIFVGHPLIDVAPKIDNTPHKNITIALLPGSRKNELKFLFSPILAAASIIKKKIPTIKFILAKSSNVPNEMYEEALSFHPELPISTVFNSTFEALNKCDYAIVASGTASLETTIMEKPMVVTYKIAPFTYFIASKLIKFDYVSLANIISKKELIPECLQSEATGELIAQRLLKIIEDPELTAQTKAGLKKVKESLGEKGAAQRVAVEIVKML